MATDEGCLRVCPLAAKLVDFLMKEPEPDVRWAAVKVLLLAKDKLLAHGDYAPLPNPPKEEM